MAACVNTDAADGGCPQPPPPLPTTTATAKTSLLAGMKAGDSTSSGKTCNTSTKTNTTKQFARKNIATTSSESFSTTLSTAATDEINLSTATNEVSVLSDRRPQSTTPTGSSSEAQHSELGTKTGTNGAATGGKQKLSREKVNGSSETQHSELGTKTGTDGAATGGKQNLSREKVNGSSETRHPKLGKNNETNGAATGGEQKLCREKANGGGDGGGQGGMAARVLDDVASTVSPAVALRSGGGAVEGGGGEGGEEASGPSLVPRDDGGLGGKIETDGSPEGCGGRATPHVQTGVGQASPSGKVCGSTKSLPSEAPPQSTVSRTTAGSSTQEKPSKAAAVRLPRGDSSETPGQQTEAKARERDKPPFPTAAHATAAAGDVAISTSTLTPSQADVAPTASVTPCARETQAGGATSPPAVPLPVLAPTGPGAHPSTSQTSADTPPSASTSVASLPKISCPAASGRQQRVSTDQKEVDVPPVAATAALGTVTSPLQQIPTPASEQGIPSSSSLPSSKLPAIGKASNGAAAAQADAPHGKNKADAASEAPSPAAAVTTAPKLLVAGQPSPGVFTTLVPSHLPASVLSVEPSPTLPSQAPPPPQAAPTPTPTPTPPPALKNKTESVAPTAATVSAASEVVSAVKEPKSKRGSDKRCASGESVGDGGGNGDAGGRSRKRPKVSGGQEEKRVGKKRIRPVPVPVYEPELEIPEVSEADVGKMVLSETSAGILTGVVERFSERNGLGVWSIRYENGKVEQMDDCGELHDDMCAYFEFAGNAAVAEGKKVRTRSKSLVQEQVRARLFADGEEVVGRRVCKVVDKTLCHGEVTRYIQPTRDGEIDRWRVEYDNGDTADLESFELVRPLLRYVERHIEQREVHWGFRVLSAYLRRTEDGSARPFATLAGISASMPAAS